MSDDLPATRTAEGRALMERIADAKARGGHYDLTEHDCAVLFGEVMPTRPKPSSPTRADVARYMVGLVTAVVAASAVLAWLVKQ